MLGKICLLFWHTVRKQGHKNHECKINEPHEKHQNCAHAAEDRSYQRKRFAFNRRNSISYISQFNESEDKRRYPRAAHAEGNDTEHKSGNRISAWRCRRCRHRRRNSWRWHSCGGFIYNLLCHVFSHSVMGMVESSRLLWLPTSFPLSRE